MTAMLPAPSTPSRTLSIRPLLFPADLGVGSERTTLARRGNARVVIAQDRAQNLLGVLADRRCLGRSGQFLIDEVQRREDLVAAQVLRREQREPVGELGVVEQGPRRIDRGDGRVDPSAELEPFLRRFGAEDVAQLVLELAVAAGV